MTQRTTENSPTVRVRLDQWLWAARFFKTRALANHAAEQGRVRMSESRLKPGREVHIGDLLEITTPSGVFEVMVRDLASVRGPAAQARLLYSETEGSVAARLRADALRQLAVEPAWAMHGRPTKRDRRALMTASDGWEV